jgi:hypothetical protein
MTALRLPDDCQIFVKTMHIGLRIHETVHELSNVVLPDDCLATAWRLPGDCLATAWRLPGDCLATAWRLPGDCLATAWRLPGDCLTA